MGRSRRRRGAMSEPSPTQAVNDRAMARAQEEVTRRTALGEFGQPPNLALRDRAMKEIFEQELSRLSHVIRCGDRVFSGSTEVENRIEEALSAIDPGRVVTAAARGADENKFKTPIQRLAQMFRRNA